VGSAYDNETPAETDQAARRVLGELGPNMSTEFLIAVTSVRTKVEPDEIVEAFPR
jgi:hypothetical protein